MKKFLCLLLLSACLMHAKPRFFSKPMNYLAVHPGVVQSLNYGACIMMMLAGAYMVDDGMSCLAQAEGSERSPWYFIPCDPERDYEYKVWLGHAIASTGALGSLIQFHAQLYPTNNGW